MHPADWTALQARSRADRASAAEWDTFLAELQRQLENVVSRYRQSRTSFPHWLRGAPPPRPPRVRGIIVARDAADELRGRMPAAIQAAFPQAVVSVHRPGLFGPQVMVAPYDRQITRHVQQLVDETQP